MTPTATDSAAGVDPAGLVLCRRMFGALMLVSVVRFVALGWVEQLYLAPEFHFTYTGLHWVRPWPPVGMYAHLAIMGIAALLLALDVWPRRAAFVFAVLFTYAELISKSAYLNHYYLVSLLAFWFAALPVRADRSVPRGVYPTLRIQVGLVYVFAGFAKLDADWLLRAEPLLTWLQAHGDMPLVGRFLARRDAAFVMSWAGALFDLLIVPALLWRRTRRWAYAAAVGFHLSIWLLFPVGMFSFVMLVAATIFFAPDWPRRWMRPTKPIVKATALPRWAWATVGIALCVQVLAPLRGHMHPGVLNWHEHGYRFAWRVMLTEKTGQLEYRVCVDGADRCARVRPGPDLSPLQRKMLLTQPDMIRQYARRIADRYPARAVRVYADSWVALNGRASQRMIAPTVDLSRLSPWLGPAQWIVPLRE
jgi:vitamin K-dependent gamma-carboxylase